MRFEDLSEKDQVRLLNAGVGQGHFNEKAAAVEAVRRTEKQMKALNRVLRGPWWRRLFRC